MKGAIKAVAFGAAGLATLALIVTLQRNMTAEPAPIVLAAASSVRHIAPAPAGHSTTTAQSGHSLYDYPIQRKCWSDTPTEDDRPDVTCVSLTRGLLHSLLGKSKEQVAIIMGVPGKNHEYSHFLSNALGKKAWSGDVNVTYDESGISTQVFGVIDSADNTVTREFSYRDNAPDWERTH